MTHNDANMPTSLSKILVSTLLFIWTTGKFHGQTVNLEWSTLNEVPGLFDVMSRLSLSSDGHFFDYGHYPSAWDADPGSGVLNVSNPNAGAYLRKLNETGEIVWIKTFGQAGVSILDVVQTQDNRIACFGEYSGTIDFDNGPETVLHTSISTDLFLMLLSADGEIEWLQVFPALGVEKARHIHQESVTGDLLISGLFQISVDLDPGPNEAVMTSNGGFDAFLARFDLSGAFVWAKQLGGPSNDETVEIASDDQSNIFWATNMFDGLVDLDPNEGVINHFVSSVYDGVLIKLSPSGATVWSKRMISGDAYRFNDLMIDANNDVILTGVFSEDLDIDLSEGENLLTTNASQSSFLVKLNNDSELLWGFEFGGILEGIMLRTDQYNNIYAGGVIFGLVDFDGGPGVLNVAANQDYFVSKFNSQGHVIFAHTFGGPGADLLRGFVIGDSGNIFASAFMYEELTFDFSDVVLTNADGLTDSFIVGISQDLCAAFSLEVNELIQPSCSNLSSINVIGAGGLEPYSYSWSPDPVSDSGFAEFVDGGIYTVTAEDALGCTYALTVWIESPPAPGGIDLQPFLVTAPLITGNQSLLVLDVGNSMCTEVNSEIRLLLDPQCTFIFSEPTPSLISGDTLIWFPEILTAETSDFLAYVHIDVSTEALLGDTLCFTASALPLAIDSQASNNIKEYCREVQTSYDPNDMQMFPAGVCEPKYIEFGTTVLYTVRFQNTGTSDAINVLLECPLPEGLDLSSLQVLSTGHPLAIVEISDSDLLLFRFDDINLPPASLGLEESIGFVVFSFTVLNPQMEFTEIVNLASIYFDYNEPIVTNSVYRTTVSSIPTISVEVDQSVVPVLTATQQNASYQWLACPNGVLLVDETGQSLDYSDYTFGSYQVEINYLGCQATSTCVAVNPEYVPHFQTKRIELSPNPSNGLITIISPSSLQDESIEVMSAEGKSVALFSRAIDHSDIDLSHLQPGLYLIRVGSYSTRLIIE